jgi:hypothetical protein
MSTDSEPNANRPWPTSARGWMRLVLALVGVVAAAGLVIAAGAWAGHAITERASGGVAGGGSAFVVIAVVFQRFVLRESVIETGCIAFVFVVCLAMLYYVTRIVEQKLEAASQHTAAVGLAVEEGKCE